MRNLLNLILITMLLTTTFLFADENSEFKKAKSYCVEKSHKLCLKSLKKFNKKYPKSKFKREASLLEAKSLNRRYSKYKALKILESFTRESKQDKIHIEAMSLYIDLYIYQKGIYKTKNFKRVYDLLKANYRLFKKDKILKNRMMENYYKLYSNKDYYSKDKKKIIKDVKKRLLELSDTNSLKARYYYTLGNRGLYKAKNQKSISYLNTVINEFPSGKYYYNALYALVNYYNSKQEFIKSVKILEKAKERVTILSKRFYQISNKIAYIKNPTMSVYTNYTFLPNNAPIVALNYRNTNKLDINIVKVNDVKKLLPKNGYYNQVNALNAYNSLSKNDKNIIKTWNKKLINKKDYKYHSETIKLEKLKPGTYILYAKTQRGIKAATVINVSEYALVVKAAPNKFLAYVANAITGVPVANADVYITLNKYNYKNNKYETIEKSGKTDDSGVFTLNDKDFNRKRYSAPSISILATKNGNTAFSNTYGGYYYWNYYDKYSSYSFTDRPAYRPSEEVFYKSFIRFQKDGKYTIPDEKFKVIIMDAKGKKVVEKELTLTKAGTLSGSFKIAKNAPLGQYSMYVVNSMGSYIYRNYGYFRVEEYKLPEFKMTINSKDSIYKPGQKIKVEIDTQYYFGGAVKNAKGEVLVYEQPYRYYYWYRRPYYWYYNNWKQQQNPYAAYGSYKGTLLKKYKIKTDKSGKAYIEIKTKSIKQIEKELTKKYGKNYTNWIKNQRNRNKNYYSRRHYYGYYDYYYYYRYYYSYDRKYMMEVRLTDKSRREIIGNKEFKVTENPFYINLRPIKYVYEPNENISLNMKVSNANGEAVKVKGKLKIYKYYYNQKAKKGENKFIKEFSVDVPRKDNFIYNFKLKKEGYYYAVYEVKNAKNIITGASYIYMSNRKYAKLYVDKDISVIPDKDYYAPNEKAKVLITSKYPDSYVLITIEGETIFKYQIEYIKEGSKIVELQLDKSMTPNVTIKAGLITNLAYHQNQKEIIIPPLDKFLTINVEKSKTVYQPGEKAEFKVKVTDYKGNPIKNAELSLGIVDSSVYYIQSDYAKDIQQFYYSKRNQLSVNTSNSFYNTPYYNNDKGVELKQKISLDAQKESFGVGDMETEKSLAVDGISTGRLGSGGSGFRGSGFGGGGSKRAKASRSFATKSAARPMKKRKMAYNKRDTKANYDFDDDNISGQIVKKTDFKNVKVRTKFASTAFWSPSFTTDKNGEAVVKMKFPENLTSWKIVVRAITADTMIGDVKTTVKTKKDILVRLQAPRFFLERDRVTISGNIHNYSDKDDYFDIKLDVKGGLKLVKEQKTRIFIKKGEDKRVDFVFDVIKKGNAEITLYAKSSKGNDAMMLKYPIKIYGSLKIVSDVSNTSERTVSKLILPVDRIKSGTKLEISVAPSIAAITLASLDYLAQYPYGCVEQTMSRFLPTVIALRMVRELGLDTSFFSKGKNVDDMVKKGLKRLYDFQLSNGGWGWWKNDRYNQWMTAYVVYGLSVALDTDVKVDQKVLNRGIVALKNSLKYNKSDIHTMAYALYALSFSKQTVKKALNKVYKKRDKLNAYSKALLAITMHKLAKDKEAKILLRNLEDDVHVDKKNKTAFYGNNYYWYWYNGSVESTAFVLRAYLMIDKNNKRVEQLLKWLVYNRKGNRWNYTKDTAHAVYALTDYLRVFKQITKNGELDVKLNGKLVKTIKFDKDSIVKHLNGWGLTFDDKDLKSGENTIEFVKKGKENVYFSNFLTYFSQEEHIKADGHELKVKRRYKKILKNGKFKVLKEGDTVKSGDRIEVQLDIYSKNNYSYIMIDDFKPSGMENVRLTSGGSSAGGTYANMEIRDDKTVFFVSYMNQGKHVIKYELRAEIPGIFHSMPTKVNAMYVPRLKGNSSSTILKIKD